jgi:uncharacterized beta-barrel protein YwiB (DUF1934 family)
MEQVHNKLYKFKNQSDAQNDPKTHTVLQIAEKCLIIIDEGLVQRLGIKDGDTVSRVEDGIVRLPFKIELLKVTRLTQQMIQRIAD